MLVTDLDAAATRAYATAYPRLRSAAHTVELTLATYFGDLGPNTATALRLPVDVLHLDLVRRPDQLGRLLDEVPGGFGLSLGLVDGRNIWRTDLAAAVALGQAAVDRLGHDRVQVAPSCSLLHVPVDLDSEIALDGELRTWLAFATQRLDEVDMIRQVLDGHADAIAEGLAANARAIADRRRSTRVHRADVADRAARVTPRWRGARRLTPNAAPPSGRCSTCRCCRRRRSARSRRPVRSASSAPASAGVS